MHPIKKSPVSRTIEASLKIARATNETFCEESRKKQKCWTFSAEALQPQFLTVPNLRLVSARQKKMQAECTPWWIQVRAQPCIGIRDFMWESSSSSLPWSDRKNDCSQAPEVPSFLSLSNSAAGQPWDTLEKGLKGEMGGGSRGSRRRWWTKKMEPEKKGRCSVRIVSNASRLSDAIPLLQLLRGLSIFLRGNDPYYGLTFSRNQLRLRLVIETQWNQMNEQRWQFL